ncbi:hypothetical protein M407DRAFT_240646 [Tulasnella calospora MUT 4182]|uniref:Uncharacterized protein n=1 Tax=Tulasnella calospora MUT 4182 TaxID=1051891 RepID=A0A0C3LJU3_9AGAM|nr:hypothetical protein M407DRAFT_240646 [Tulasnella calospora MUT 4182]
MTSATAGPSQFAQLLRRSKFASFDPAISQIYTTSGGYAHRGDFGLKRPFPPSARNKNPYVVVKAVDDSLGQTQWSTAQNQGRWIRRFDESGAGADPAFRSSWAARGRVMAEWHLDSSFDQPWSQKKLQEETPAMLPNWKRMSRPEFDKYLNKLRRKRGSFRQFLQDQRQTAYNEEMEAAWDYYEQRSPDIKPPSPPEPVNLLKESRPSNITDYRAFLQHDANEKVYPRKGDDDKPSAAIVPSPHPNAGLSYTHENKLQRAFLNPTLPARVVVVRNATDPRRIYATAPQNPVSIAVAGTLAEVKGIDISKENLRLDAVSRGQQDVTAGEIQATIDSVNVSTAPHVVGKHSGLGGGRILVKASEFHLPSSVIHGRKFNPHPPGTPEYVAWVAPPPFKSASALTPTTFGKPGAKPKRVAIRETSAQLRELAKIMRGTTQPKDNTKESKEESKEEESEKKDA